MTVRDKERDCVRLRRKLTVREGGWPVPRRGRRRTQPRTRGAPSSPGSYGMPPGRSGSCCPCPDPRLTLCHRTPSDGPCSTGASPHGSQPVDK